MNSTSGSTSGSDRFTTKWLTETLRQAGILDQGAVTAVKLERIGTGQMAETFRAGLSYLEATVSAPSSLIIKFPADDPGSRAIATAMGLYQGETGFYRDIAPLLTTRIPHCYFVEIDRESGDFTLLLEDLSHLEPGDDLAGATPDQCSAALAELVGLQAPTWNSTAVARLPWLGAERGTIEMFDAIPLGCPALLERFGDDLDASHVALIEEIAPLSGDWARSWTAPTVLMHGDFRNDNLLFDHTPGAESITVIDFQTVRLAPPGLDVAYYLSSSLPPEARRECERDLVEEHHARLQAAGIAGFSADDAWQAYREGTLYGFFVMVGLANQVEPSERGDRLVVNQIRRHATAAIDLEAAAAAGLVPAHERKGY